MSEKTNNAPKWSEDLKAKVMEWAEANPGHRSILVIAVESDKEDNLEASSSIMGNPTFLEMAMTAAMNDEREDNNPGRIMRISAMRHLMSKAQYAGKIEISVNDESHE